MQAISMHFYLKQKLDYKKLDAIYDSESVTDFGLLNNEILNIIHCSKSNNFKIERHINLHKIRVFNMDTNCVTKKELSKKMGKLSIEYAFFKDDLIFYQTYKTGINLLPDEFIFFKPDKINEVKRNYKLIDSIDNQIYLIKEETYGNTM